MATKKYVSLNKLSTFLDNLKNKFSELTHTHILNDITDYTVDNELSPTSTNPVQNKVLDAEFEAMSVAMNILEQSIDKKFEEASQIVDVFELPNDGINTNVLYRLLTATFIHNRHVVDNSTCYIVNNRPKVGEPATNVERTIITAYYDLSDGEVYGYLDETLANGFTQLAGTTINEGWYNATQLFPIAGWIYDGVISSISEDPNDSTIRLLLEKKVYTYQDDWIELTNSIVEEKLPTPDDDGHFAYTVQRREGKDAYELHLISHTINEKYINGNIAYPYQIPLRQNGIIKANEPIEDLDVANKKYVDKNTVPRMHTIDEENGHNREYYIESSELYETTETSVTIAEGQSFMVRAVPAKDSTSYSSDFSYIDADGLPIAPPVSIAREGTLVTPTVTLNSTTASWAPIEGAVKYEYLVGNHCKYSSDGSFANSNNRLFAELSKGRGVYSRYVLSSSNVPPLDPDPQDYARGYTMDTAVQRFGNKSGTHPEYNGHIRVPKDIVVPEGATDDTINVLNSFATSKKYVDTEIAKLENNIITIPRNTADYDRVFVASANNGGTTTYSLTKEVFAPIENTAVTFIKGNGLYANRYPESIHKYTADDSYLVKSTDYVTVSYEGIEQVDGSIEYDAVIVKNSETNSTGTISFTLTNEKTTGNKLVFETDFCLVEASDALSGDGKSGTGWFMRLKIKDGEGSTVLPTSTNNQFLGTYDDSSYGFGVTTGSNTKWDWGTWIHLRLEQIGTDVRLYINDEPQCTLTANREITNGLVSFIFDMRGQAYSKVCIANTFLGMVDDDWFGKRSMSVPVKDTEGQLMVPTEPTNDNHAASKAYVDSKFDSMFNSYITEVDTLIGEGV